MPDGENILAYRENEVIMANENTGATGTQAAPNAQPQAGTSQAQAADAQSSQVGGAESESGTEDVAVLQRELKEARAEAARHRTEAKKLTDAAKAAEDAKLPEQERLQRRLADLETQQSDWERERQDWQTRESVTVTALRLGYADPADAYSLIDRAALEFDESGKPRNVDKLLGDLIKAKPYLAGASRPGGSFDGGPRGTSITGTNMNDLLRGRRST